mgnify:CR=1 FL=1
MGPCSRWGALRIEGWQGGAAVMAVALISLVACTASPDARQAADPSGSAAISGSPAAVVTASGTATDPDDVFSPPAAYPGDVLQLDAAVTIRNRLDESSKFDVSVQQPWLDPARQPDARPPIGFNGVSVKPGQDVTARDIFGNPIAGATVVLMAERPTPAAARYISTGAPSPPAPMTSTFAAFSFCWPGPPTSLSRMWRW